MIDAARSGEPDPEPDDPRTTDATPDGPDATSREPLCAEARRLIAAASTARGRPDDPEAGPDTAPYDRIVVLLRRAVAAGEWSAPALLASTYLDRGKRRPAVDVLSPAVYREDRDDLAGLLGQTLAELGDHDSAEAAFMRGLDDGDPDAMNGYGLFLWGRGRTQEAGYVLDRAARAGDDLAPLNLVTLHLEELDDLVGAAVVAQEFHDEARPSTLVALADVRLASGRPDDAEVLYRRAVELGADGAHIYYGWFLQDRREDLPAAEEQLRAAWDAGELRAAFHLGRFLFDTGRFDDAAPWFEEAAFRGDTEAQAILEAEYRGLFDLYDD